MVTIERTRGTTTAVCLRVFGDDAAVLPDGRGGGSGVGWLDEGGGGGGGGRGGGGGEDGGRSVAAAAAGAAAAAAGAVLRRPRFRGGGGGGAADVVASLSRESVVAVAAVDVVLCTRIWR